MLLPLRPPRCTLNAAVRTLLQTQLPQLQILSQRHQQRLPPQRVLCRRQQALRWQVVDWPPGLPAQVLRLRLLLVSQTLATWWLTEA